MAILFKNKLKQVSGILKARLLKMPVPINIGFEITHLCNLDCKYCDRHTRGSDELSTEEIVDILNGFYSLGTRALSLDGGEPLAHKDFPKIVEHILGLGMVLRINSNGILVPRVIDWVKHADKLKVSLDGDEPSHDSMRGNGAFRKAIHGVEKARENGIFVELTCVLHQRNLHSVPALLKLAEKLDAPVIFQPVRTSLFDDQGRNGSAWMPGYDDLRNTFAWLLQEKRNNKYIANRKSSLRHFIQFPDDVKLPCAAGWINCTVDPQGYIYHCALISRDAYKISIREHGVKDAFKTMTRFPCTQCWCARTVEENYAWGLSLKSVS